MRTYVDSSVVLRHILSGDHALNALSLSDEVGLSDLLIIECQRVLQRERMAAHLRAFIAAKQYDELFSQGGCFHFAQRAWKAEIGKLHCTVAGLDPTKADHVFVVVSDDVVFDRLGFRSVYDLLTERKSDQGQNRAISADEVDAHMLARGQAAPFG